MGSDGLPPRDQALASVFALVKFAWKTLNNVSLPGAGVRGNVGTQMNTGSDGVDCNLQARFCLRFQRLLRELIKRGYPLAEGFGPAWEAAMEDVPLEEAVRGPVYRRLIAWASAQLLFACPLPPASYRGRDAVVEN